VLEVEPPGPPDRSELGLLGGVLGAGSEHWSCGPAVGPEVQLTRPTSPSRADTFL